MENDNVNGKKTNQPDQLQESEITGTPEYKNFANRKKLIWQALNSREIRAYLTIPSLLIAIVEAIRDTDSSIKDKPTLLLARDLFRFSS